MAQHRSISQRLGRAKSAEAKISVLADWSKSWERETMDLIRQLERSIQTNDYDLLCKTTGQLKAVSEKHFRPLPSVLTWFIKPEPATPAPEPKQVAPGKAGPMPPGYISAREWAKRNDREPRRGQKILTDWPAVVPAARKVRNPRGGVDIWAVPEDTPWPF